MENQFKVIEGGICAAKGFKASGTYCGIKKPSYENPKKSHKNDICLYASDKLCNTAAVYTTNKVKGAPIIVTKANLEKSNGKAIAVIANSKNNSIEFSCEFVKIKIKEKAQEGKTNKAIIDFLSKELKFPKSKINILNGHKSAIKTIELG